jgi:Na+-driven multidrug efflux pump
LLKRGQAFGLVLAGWVLSIPFWPSALPAQLRTQEVEAATSTAHLLVAFYALFAVNHLLDSAFYGAGRTDFLWRQTVLVNLGVFGAAFLLHQLGYWTPTLLRVTFLFGLGIAADSAITVMQYVGWRRAGFSTRIAGHPSD